MSMPRVGAKLSPGTGRSRISTAMLGQQRASLVGFDCATGSDHDRPSTDRPVLHATAGLIGTAAHCPSVHPTDPPTHRPTARTSARDRPALPNNPTGRPIARPTVFRAARPYRATSRPIARTGRPARRPDRPSGARQPGRCRKPHGADRSARPTPPIARPTVRPEARQIDRQIDRRHTAGLQRLPARPPDPTVRT